MSQEFLIIGYLVSMLLAALILGVCVVSGARTIARALRDIGTEVDPDALGTALRRGQDDLGLFDPIETTREGSGSL